MLNWNTNQERKNKKTIQKAHFFKLIFYLQKKWREAYFILKHVSTAFSTQLFWNCVPLIHTLPFFTPLTQTAFQGASIVEELPIKSGWVSFLPAWFSELIPHTMIYQQIWGQRRGQPRPRSTVATPKLYAKGMHKRHVCACHTH